MELTEITLANQHVWWTFGLEAFGPARNVAESLQTEAAVSQERQPPNSADGLPASYPESLANYADNNGCGR